MVDAFSEYAKTPEITLKNTNINGLIREVVELYRINQTNAKIVLHLEGYPILNIDGDRIRQLLVNLIKNALDAMHQTKANKDQVKEQSTLTICSAIAKTAENKPQFKLTLSDNGPGIDEALLLNLFEPYKTTKAHGDGLGLAIVKRIVEEHDGRVLAKNNKDQGASIHVFLPYDKSLQ